MGCGFDIQTGLINCLIFFLKLKFNFAKLNQAAGNIFYVQYIAELEYNETFNINFLKPSVL